MNWQIPNGCHVQRTNVGEMALWFVEVEEAAISLWALGLCLLHSKLIDRLIIADLAGATALQLTPDFGLRRPCNCALEWRKCYPGAFSSRA